MEKARRACEAIFLDEELPQIIVGITSSNSNIYTIGGPTLLTWQAFTNCVLERAGTPCCASTLVLHLQDAEGGS
jgi:hypothetical protein